MVHKGPLGVYSGGKGMAGGTATRRCPAMCPHGRMLRWLMVTQHRVSMPPAGIPASDAVEAHGGRRCAPAEAAIAYGKRKHL
jgi:hypothetical protein